MSDGWSLWPTEMAPENFPGLQRKKETPLDAETSLLIWYNL